MTQLVACERSSIPRYRLEEKVLKVQVYSSDDQAPTIYALV